MVHQEGVGDVDKDMNPILRKGNYVYWKTMTEASLVFLGCWDAVEPGFTAAEKLRPDYMKMDNKARAYIFQHVRPEYLEDIRTLKTAKECWKALEDVHVDGHRFMHAGTENYGEEPQHRYLHILRKDPGPVR